MNQKKSNYITHIGYKVLVDELNLLIKEERPKTTEIVKWAASLGDRSENADYIYGKKKLREIDRRIRFLNSRIDDAVVINPTEIKSEKVQFGATVLVCNEEGEEKTFSIVGIDESKPAEGKISWVSPIAKSMLGKTVGDEVLVRSPKGEMEYEILEINYKEIL
ncbi:transcription elongation factor GreB [Bacteriovorax sp. Seq25_V]|uniref:transcription elongation factor GreB n=1 Tax=Bacteriovorax sp. Seq25_V TaxID=1201288 RepID=UPI00038A1ADC|nr:transcription elongation factor GreB [Bacteriovorax sp. Seq25_V]EQC45331.1 transcription elongation factor GreB [Bacteriovorax sp. Seq25_V]